MNIFKMKKKYFQVMTSTTEHSLNGIWNLKWKTWSANFQKSLNQIPDMSEVLTDKKDDFVDSCVSSCSLLFFWVGALTPTEIGGECSWLTSTGLSLQYLITWKNLFKASLMFFCLIAKIRGLVKDFKMTKIYPTACIKKSVWWEKSSGL